MVRSTFIALLLTLLLPACPAQQTSAPFKEVSLTLEANLSGDLYAAAYALEADEKTPRVNDLMCWSDKPATLTDPAGYLFGPSEPPERGRKIGWDDPFDENLLSDLPVDKLRVIDLTVGESYLMPGPRESWVVLRITGHAKRGTPLAAGSLLVSFEWKWARKPRALRGSEIARKQVHDLVFTLGQYRQDYEGVYPDKLGQLMAPPDPDYKIYVTEKEALRDPWGRDFLYTVDNERMRLGTYGADGAPGGEDEDRDYFAEVPR